MRSSSSFPDKINSSRFNKLSSPYINTKKARKSEKDRQRERKSETVDSRRMQQRRRERRKENKRKRHEVIIILDI